jgi:hypothetical protein
MQQGRGIHEMSQYQSFMFSDAVYLFGKIFSSTPNFGNEELPDGTWVNQKKLAEQVVLAAFAYLYHKKLIDIYLGERISWFRKKKTAKVKKLQSTAPDMSALELVIFSFDENGRGHTYVHPDMSALELVIFSSIRDRSDMYGITTRLGPNPWFTSSNPWRDVLQIVKKNLLQRGILKQVVKGKVLFITTYKYVVNGDISKEAKQVIELQKTLKELQSKGELYQQMLSDIEKGIASREYQGVD